MTNIIEIICENLGGKVEVPMGTPLSEVAKRVAPGPYPFLAALVNNRIKELYYKIYTPVTVRFVDITSFAGIRVYQRTAWFLLQKAVKDLYPGQTLHIRHSMGQSGFYCEIDGIDSTRLRPGDLAAVRRRKAAAQHHRDGGSGQCLGTCRKQPCPQGIGAYLFCSHRFGLWARGYPGFTTRWVPAPRCGGIRWRARNGGSRRTRGRPTAARDARP